MSVNLNRAGCDAAMKSDEANLKLLMPIIAENTFKFVRARPLSNRSSVHHVGQDRTSSVNRGGWAYHGRRLHKIKVASWVLAPNLVIGLRRADDARFTLESMRVDRVAPDFICHEHLDGDGDCCSNHGAPGHDLTLTRLAPLHEHASEKFHKGPPREESCNNSKLIMTPCRSGYRMCASSAGHAPGSLAPD